MASSNGTFKNGLMTHGSVSVAIILSTVVLITITGNILVLTAVGTSQRLKQRKSTSFIVSLACADLLMGVVIMPGYLSTTYHGYWHFGRFLCQLYYLATLLSITASINTLCVIAIDRYVAITSPLRYESLLNFSRVRILIVTVWVVSTLLSTPSLQISKWGSKSSEAIACYEDPTCCEFLMNKEYTITFTIVTFFCPLVVMILVYVRVLMVAQKQAQQIRKDFHTAASSAAESTNNTTNAQHQQVSASERRAIKALGLIMGVFTLCWFPCFVLVLMQAFCNYCIPDKLYVTTVWFGYSNSALNPILYSRSPDFLAAYKRVLCHYNKFKKLKPRT